MNRPAFNPDARDNVDKSPGQMLWAAVRMRNTVAAEKIFDLYPDVDVNKKHGNMTLLHAAANFGDEGFALTRLLLEHNADVYALSAANETALHRAAYMNGAETIRLLLKFGADIDAQNDMQLTALAIAVERAFTATIELLLEEGADDSIADGWKNKTPRQKAAEYKNPLLRQKLVTLFEKSARTPTPAGAKRIAKAASEKTKIPLKKPPSIRFTKKEEGG